MAKTGKFHRGINRRDLLIRPWHLTRHRNKPNGRRYCLMKEVEGARPSRQLPKPQGLNIVRFGPDPDHPTGASLGRLDHTEDRRVHGRKAPRGRQRQGGLDRVGGRGDGTGARRHRDLAGWVIKDRTARAQTFCPAATARSLV